MTGPRPVFRAGKPSDGGPGRASASRRETSAESKQSKGSRGHLMPAVVAVGLIGFVAAVAGIGVRATFGAHVAVDETQYVLTALSLAEDHDLDISDELAEQRWRDFADVEPPVQTQALADGRQISPHDPLLPALLAVPVALGGWVAAKLALALLAGLLASLTLWVAVRRLWLPVRFAAIGVATAATSAPLAVYGQQLYPELPAALVTMAGVAVMTGPLSGAGREPDRGFPAGETAGPARRRNLILLGIAVAILPWLSIKYAPVAAMLALLGVSRWWRAGRRGSVVALVGGLVAAAVAYLVVHRLGWGGWTVYASGDHFQRSGEFGVVGFHPHYFGRGLRLVGLFVDREYGIAAWQPAWLILLPAAAAVVAWLTRQGANPAAPGGGRLTRSTVPSSANPTASSLRRDGDVPLMALAVVAAGWLMATFVAVTMHGYWWPGRQLVVVLPLAVLMILSWLARCRGLVRRVALSLGLVGVFSYVILLVDGYQREITWVSGFQRVDDPVYALIRYSLPDYRGDFWPLHIAWIGVFIALLVAGSRAARTASRPP